MNFFDIILIFILVVSFISGFATGFVKGLFGLAGLILGVLLASNLYASFSSTQVGQIVTFIIIFFIVIIVFAILGSIVKKLVHAIMLGWLDRILGAFLAVFSAGVFIVLATTAYTYFFGSNNTIDSSTVFNGLMNYLSWVPGILPDAFKSNLKMF